MDGLCFSTPAIAPGFLSRFWGWETAFSMPAMGSLNAWISIAEASLADRQG